MLIKETVERECCHATKDLVKMQQRYFYFCKHCGRHWQDKGGSEPDSPGLQPLPWPWENK